MPNATLTPWQTKTNEKGRPKSLPFLSDPVNDEIDELVRKTPHKLAECPTCGNREKEIEPGLVDWLPGSYTYLGEKHECDCQRQIALFRHYLRARIPEEYMRFNEADWAEDSDQIAKAEVENYLLHWPALRKYGLGLGFYAKRQGVGKTFLATWLARKLIAAGVQVSFLEFSRLLMVYKMPYEERRKEEERLRESNVLILDEIACPVTETQQEFFAVAFEELLRHRSNYNKVTIFTTNLEPIEMEESFPRVYGILARKTEMIEVKGQDFRKKFTNTLDKELALRGEARPIT